jgi:hypothetical protein
VGNITNCGCEIWTVDYRLKKKAVKSRKGFWKGATINPKILNIRNGVIREIVSNETIWKRMGKSMYCGWEVTGGQR